MLGCQGLFQSMHTPNRLCNHRWNFAPMMVPADPERRKTLTDVKFFKGPPSQQSRLVWGERRSRKQVSGVPSYIGESNFDLCKLRLHIFERLIPNITIVDFNPLQLGQLFERFRGIIPATVT